MCDCGDHAFAPLTKGGVALVSPQDVDVLLESCWRVHINKRWQYRTILSSNGGKMVLARRVMDAKQGEIVDHRNGDTADCRRPNLRLCDPSTNQANRRSQTRGRALPKGVRATPNGRFEARIVHRGERICLGRYDTVDAAVRAYAGVAIALYGEFARFG